MDRTGRMRSVDASRFAMVARPDVPRSAFDVLQGHKTTFNAGYLVPIYVDEVLPGDSLRLRLSAFIRLSTPLVPMMDNLEYETFFFFVPNRILWSNWERFMGEQANPTDTTSFLVPQVDIVNADLAPGFLADYMGLTVNGSANTLHVNALPFRAYNLIWNDWFRDEDLQTKASVPLGDGPDTLSTTYALRQRNKRHDYFTSARPWPQKPMNVSVMPDATGLSLSSLAGMQYQDLSGVAMKFKGAGAPVTGLGSVGALGDNGAQTLWQTGNRQVAELDTSNSALSVARNPGGYPDIRVLVNDMRTAVMVQGMLERNARGGTRYAEIVRAHFGVVSPDARLQRPEYLGGGRAMIAVNPVAQTSASGVAGTTTKLGELAAMGSAMVHGHGFSQSFTEHGVILGLANVRSYLTYQQGNERMWYRRSQFDFYWPGFAHLPEQAVLSGEIFADASANDLTVFGYQERWAEYKWKPSRTSGYFRSTVATPLDMWHLGEKFANRAAASLTSGFVTENPPISRVLQVATNWGEDFLFDSLIEAKWVRPMPMFSIPGVGGRL